MRKYGKLLRCSKRYQMKKLTSSKNRRKTGFDKLSLPYLSSRLREEHDELDAEITRFRGKTFDYEAVRDEAADVANFAAMIILHCTRELVSRSWRRFWQHIESAANRFMFRYTDGI